jgi:exonuclease SbcC
LNLETSTWHPEPFLQMYLRSISLKNYRRFKSVDLEFPDGIVGIIGNNGAGKSTLMEAIAWALFGTDASRTSKDQIKSVSSSKADVCQVVVDFEMNGDNFRVVRELKGATHSVDASVIINKKVAARGNNPVNELIQTTLDMDYRAFMTSFYAKQRELNALSDFQPHKRKELLARMLGIETVDTALKNLRLDKRDLQVKLELDRSHLKDGVELEAERKEKSEALSQLRDEHKAARERFDSETSGLTEAEESWKGLKAKQDEHTRLNQRSGIIQTEKRGLEAQLKTQDEERSKLVALDSESKRLQELLAPYEEIKKRIDALEELRIKAEKQKLTQSQNKEIEASLGKDQERLAFLRKELEPKSEIEKNLGEVREKLVSVEKELEGKRNLYVRAEAASKSIGDEKAKLESQLKHVEELGPDSICDRCLRPMGPDYQSIRQHLIEEQGNIGEKLKSAEGEKERLRRTGGELKKSRIELEERKEALQKSIQQFSRMEGERQNLERGVEEKNKNLSSLGMTLKSLAEVEYDPEHHKRLKVEFEGLDTLKQRSTELASQLKRLPLLEKSRQELAGKLQEVAQEEAGLKEALLNLQYSGEDYQRAERSLEDTRKRAHSAELALRDIGHRIEMLEKEIDRIKKEVEGATRLAQSIKGWEEQQRYLERLDLLMSDFRVSLIGRIRPTLSRYARGLFLDLCDNRYEDFELDEDYEILIQDRGEKYPLSRFSGGETDLANLCLRIAISLLISESSRVDFSFIILDEIFGSQDLLRKESILVALARLKNRFRQMFLITHIEDIKDSVENLIYVTENDDGSSDLLLQ